jgi:serine/threonine-protein kinase
MAPEQLEGRGDRRADIYGAAAILWELLTGERLRNADGQGAQILVQILYGLVTPPSSHEPSAVVLDELVMRGLRRHSEDRYTTAREMAAMLAATVTPASPERVAEVLQELVGEVSAPSVPPSSAVPQSMVRARRSGVSHRVPRTVRSRRATMKRVAA